MSLLLIIVFSGVFTVVVLLMIAGGAAATSQSEQALAILDVKPVTGRPGSGDQTADFRKNMVLSAIPWMNRWLLKIELAPRLRVLLCQADLKWTAGGLLLMSMSCFAFPAWLIELRTGSSTLALLAGVLLAFLPVAFVFYKRGRRFSKFEQGLPEALDLIVSALRAGHSLNAALSLVARECPEPIRSEFKTCFDEQNYGLELRAAMDNMTIRLPLPDLRIATTAILIQKETGGNLAEVLSKTAEVIRERFRLRRQVRVHTAHGRMTGWVIGILPLALLVVLYLVNPDMESILWKREIGIHLLYAGAAMLLVGGLIIRRIVRMDV